ncbi:putative S-adenosylmethionine-dependent methyltransferase [Thozetella sp. PMI_491]|nr:putative S-adenosylmethionine-dependent methyltransferase [Thozetella sp. PMI_491]
MSPTLRHLVPPSACLPSLRRVEDLTEEKIAHALRNLHQIYCPLPNLLDFAAHAKHSAQAVDSGYASEDDGDDEELANRAEALRADAIERGFAERWLTGFVGRAEELPLDEETCQRFVDDACLVLSSLAGREDVDTAEDRDPGMKREFAFALEGQDQVKIKAVLHDTPMQMGDDHTDVGLQTWGASVVLSEILCNSPHSFGLDATMLDANSRVVELGAGTGLVSLVLSSLLPHTMEKCPSVVATDYHPTVLRNLDANIAAHLATQEPAAPVSACLLDWSAPSRAPPLDMPAKMLIAADVVYALEHAVWLRDCAGCLLAPDGVFWLMVSVRPNGKFEGIGDTVEAAFADIQACPAAEDGRVLKILDMERVKYRRGVGRADEVGYKLFRIGWA